ncbi:Formylglycine-generating enzyme, required for sulfatase activity, contains SUMF1/FGE domain [Chitinophaga arvensicola]|uniref:Formylglycine-generating enzyme, required for sulfatase activity, contains SUMF1/FGE domain n=2 Tax=Chitinophaga arvensicola TaxID=29529 RepID=A0A1I0RRD2_9BACT|nr:Formylglycine-generating enzyme, required for sulfatase activity, contains SUMF1/FGE domain [Chitinophaga arvensicola]
MMKRYLPLLLLLAACQQRVPPAAEQVGKAACCVVPSRFATTADRKDKDPENMIWVTGGQFMMGTDEKEAYDQERPAHPVKVDGFWIDKTEVTNEAFKAFVDATKYVTVAERKPTWEEISKQLPPGTPKPDDALLIPGSMVFVAPDHPVSTEDISNWWHWVAGASWQHPEGPGSNLDGRWKHPVVQIAWEDANAYAKWAGKRLPTEAEWEYAARGGQAEKRYAWGNEFKPGQKYMANTFQGHFPDKNSGEDGFKGTAPVASFPANAYGLYDMTGNVWEWTADWYDASLYKKASLRTAEVDPKGPASTYDPEDRYAIKRVTKGGSYLCANDYCVNYRPSARRGTAFDSGASHIGFRCVKDKTNDSNKTILVQNK